MKPEELIARYREDERAEQLKNAIAGGNKKIHLTGLVGSADACVLTAIYGKTDHNHLVILPDKESAAYHYNDLQALLKKKDIYFFPDSFKRPGFFEELNNNNILLRTESLNRFLHPSTRSEIMVTYPEALLEKVVNKGVLEKNTLHIVHEEKLDMDFLIDVMHTYGFERTDFVYEPGQFSIRGGIIDIFSFGNEWPYRVELFDDEVESIRTYDPVSQLSRKKIARVTIVPNIQTHFNTNEKVDLLDLLDDRTLIWGRNMPLIIELMNSLTVKVHQAIEAVHTDDPEHPLYVTNDQTPFINVQRFLDDLEPRTVLESGEKTYYRPDIKVVFKTRPQPAFNKNFNLLVKDLRTHQEQGYSNYIFSDSTKQIERFYAIFDDIDPEVTFTPVYTAIESGFLDDDLKLVCYTDHQIFARYHKYHIREAFSKSKALNMKALRELQKGDYVTHIDHGVGIFSGLEKIEVNGQTQEAVRLIYDGNDLLYVGINSLHKISKFAGKDGKKPRINKLGSDAWERMKRKTKKKVKDIARDLIKLYAQRKTQPGFAFLPDTYLQTELEASFIYEDTPDQTKATEAIKEDMEKATPMDRLVCGDVGFGKTEVAIRAAFKAVTDSKQVAVLVPTTILAMQHHRTFTERLSEFPVNIDYINRFKSARQKRETLEKLANGELDIIIGTHALLSDKVKFKDLGLMIVDEEQKFGVAAKEKLKKLRLNVDTLTLTATPIPRTLQFSLMGARDLSVINTPPPNRQPIETEVHVFNDEMVRDAIYHEYYRGGQVFFIHNRVKDIVEVAALVQRLCPDIEVGIAHGQMEGHELEKKMIKFIDRGYDVLVSTNIIEAGLDIPNANTIIINNAHHFGMSDLHQLRGRVGRSNKKAFCYLFTPPLSTLTPEARKRLQTLEQFSDLGSGFHISMRDLDIRGAGNLLGGEQSGFISDIGYDTYHKILDEAIHELKNDEFRDVYEEQLMKDRDFVREVTVDTDVEMLIPDAYVTNINERLKLYQELNILKKEEEIAQWRQDLEDRFGPVPPPVDELLNAMRLQWLARDLGMERIMLKNKTMRCFFVSDQKSAFYASEIFSAILSWVQRHTGKARLKQTPKYLMLIFEDMADMQDAETRLEQLSDAVAAALKD